MKSRVRLGRHQRLSETKCRVDCFDQSGNDVPIALFGRRPAKEWGDGMAMRTLLLVGDGLESAARVFCTDEFETRIASDADSARAALDELPPMVVLIRGGDAGNVSSLVEQVCACLHDHPIPVLVILDDDDGISPDDLVRRGATDCSRWDEGEEALRSRVRMLCRLSELAGTVLNQRRIIERHVDRLLDARQELQSVRAEMEALIEHGPVVMFSAEAPLELGAFRSAGELEHAFPTYLDSTVFTLIGYSASDLVGDAKALRRLVPSSDLPQLAERAERLFEDGHWTCRYRVRHADGRLRWINDESRVVRRDDGAPVAVVGSLRDVTREVIASEAARGNDSILERARRLQGAQRLAGTIAHDFNNMLAIVMCHAQYAARLLPADHAAQRSLDQMLAAVVRAQAGTKLLIQLSQRKQAAASQVNVNTVVRDTLSLVEPLMGGGIRVRERLQPGVPRVSIERADFENALLNLCVNARDAMPRGGVLTISTRVERADAAHDADQVVLEVADTGVGMEDHVSEQCFEPFFSTKPQGEGTGLGLFSVAQTVRQSGGTVSVESKQGRGTTFRIRLPGVGRCAVVASVPGDRMAQRPSAGGSVLHAPGAERARIATMPPPPPPGEAI